MVVILVTLVLVIGVSGYRYYAHLDARRADVRITGARLASYLLNAWKGVGGHSGFAVYRLANPPDYDETDPNDYNPTDTDPIEFGLEGVLLVGIDEPGPPVPKGFNRLDLNVNPNYRFAVGNVNYYATFSYRDEPSKPRLLNVRVAWMNDWGPWGDSKICQPVSMTSYAGE
jgi:hypothetical protein